MKRSIEKIVSETIDRFIINENIQQIASYSDILKDYISKLANADTGDIDEWVNNFQTYVTQVYFAINRCVQNNSLNEEMFFGHLGRIGDGFLNVPPELWGNFKKYFDYGYNKTKRMLPNKLNGKNGKNSGKNGTEPNPTQVQSKKLSVLLQDLQNWENQYYQLSGQFKIDFFLDRVINDIFTTLNKLKQDYEQMAQQA